MTPSELAGEVESVIQECRGRVLGPGKEQHWTPGQPQKFETMELDGLFEFAEEELRDLVVYAVMLRIRLRRLREKIDAEDGRGVTKMIGRILCFFGRHAWRRELVFPRYGNPPNAPTCVRCRRCRMVRS